MSGSPVSGSPVSGAAGGKDTPPVLLVLGEPVLAAEVRALATGLDGHRVVLRAPAAAVALLDLPDEVRFSPLQLVARADAWTEVVAVAALRTAIGAERPGVVHAFGVRAGFVAAAAIRTLRAAARPSLVVTWPPDQAGELPDRIDGPPDPTGPLRSLERRLVARAATVSVVGEVIEATPLFALGGRDVRALPRCAADTDGVGAVRALYEELAGPLA